MNLKLQVNKRIMIAGIAVAAVAAVVTPNIAFGYLTAHDGKKNSTSFGNVSATLTEPAYPGNVSDEVKNLVFNQEIKKDPTITNTGADPLVAFIVMEVPSAELTPVADDGTESEKGWNELFVFKQTADTVQTHVNNFNNKWIRLPSKEDTDITDGSRTYVFGYSEIVDPTKKTAPLFDKIQFKTFRRNEIPATDLQKIKITSYVMQGSDIIGASGEDITKDLTVDSLGEIYDIYLNANH